MANKNNSPQKLTGTSDAIRGQIVMKDNGDIEAPESIIQTVAGARSIYYTFRAEHLKRISLYASIEGLIAGNPPYNPTDLERHGLSHIANFNNLEARSLFEKGALAFWNLLNEAETIAKFELVYDDPKYDKQQLVKFAQLMAKNWDQVIRQWPSFYVNVNTLTAQLVKLGLSPAIWPDERDWRWRVIELSRFFVADQAQSDIAQMTCVCVESTFTAQYLYEVYEKFKDKKDDDENPWDIDELAKLLLFRANTNFKGDETLINMMDLQVRLQNGDITWNDIFSDSIRIVSMLYKEYEGGISHYMFEPNFDHGNFLFRADKQYKEMQEAILIFTASPGEFTLHSNRGLGHKIFSGCQAAMQLDCSIVDAARWSSTPLIKSLATGNKDFETIRFYPGVPTNIGTAEFVQNNMGANIEQLIGASQYVIGKLQRNTANSGDDPSVPDANVGSLSDPQARMRSYREFSVLKNNIAHFYSQFDIIIRNMVAKMLRSKDPYPGFDFAKEWKDRCEADGVPKEVFDIKEDDTFWGLPKHIRVKATRVAGDGSTLANIMGLQELAPVVGSFGPKGIKEYQRQLIMATRGPEYVDAFLTPEQPDEASGGASLAGVENAIMQMGQSPVFSLDNEQRSHFVTHMALNSHLIEEIQQQKMTPIEADKVFAVSIPHTAQHVQAMQKNPFDQGFFESVKKSWNQVQEYAKLNRKNASAMLQAELRKQQKDQEQTQQVMTDEQRKDFIAQKDAQRNDFKVQTSAARADQANENRAEIMREKVQKDADNTRLKVQLEADAKKQATRPEAEIRSDIEALNGSTPAPTDIELIP